MICLPTLCSGDSRWRLSLSDQSADAIVSALLTDETNVREQQLANALRNDPVLALWAVCRSGRPRHNPSADVADVAAWLSRNALTALDWPAEVSLNDDALSPELKNQLDECAEPDKLFENGGAEGTPTDHPLPRLIWKLRRLKQLEEQFAATLEHEKLASLKELAYGASHEINNPLANISTRAQTLLRDETDSERRRKLATINAQAFRAHEMIADMMLFAHPPEPQFEQVVVQDVVDQVVAELQTAARAQGTDLVHVRDETPILIRADEGHLLVALQALGRNSLEAIAAGGAVEFAVRGVTSPDDATVRHVQIAVRDTGPGISAEVRRHIFDPFYSGREAGRGLGFGLSKCWRIVTMHGGSIDVDSQPGRGATFCIRLPASNSVNHVQPLAASA